MEEHSLLFYLHVRYEMAKKLADDIQNQPRFDYVEPYRLEERLVAQGAFDKTEYVTVTDFFDELTGNVHSFLDWGRTQYEYETYDNRYEALVLDFILKFAPQKVMDHLPEKLLNEYALTFGENVTVAALKGLLRDEWEDLAFACLDELQEEYLSDLLELAEIPFDEAVASGNF